MPRWIRAKNWDKHVGDIERIVQSPGFHRLRDEIIGLARLGPQDHVLDIGCGTGLLSLKAAPLAAYVWALDVSPSMCRHLGAKFARDGIANAAVLVSSATDLPLASDSIDVVISNYCFHHLSDADKRRALAEVRRVLIPGGRLVIGDMMFRVGLGEARSRAIVLRFAMQMLRRGPAGVLRLLNHAVRLLTGRGEHPTTVEWWHDALLDAGFTGVMAWPLDHEGGIAIARQPT